MTNAYDVVMIGGGAAGLNGALVLARARRSVLVVDAGVPRNAPAAHMHGFLSRDGTPPGELLAVGRDEVRGYGGEIRMDAVTAVERNGAAFRVTLASGGSVRARTVLIASGGVDELPEIDGLRERWGRDVAHCPYCHGYEVRDQPIGVIASSPKSVHQTLMVRQWSDDVVLFTHRTPELADADWDRLAARGVQVIDGIVDGFELTDDRITGVRLGSGKVVPRSVVFVAPYVRASVPTGLDLEVATTEFATHIVSGPTGRTSVAGVWAAGNVTDPMAQVIISAAGGAMAGADINGHLVEADTAAALRAREPFSAEAEADMCERVLGDRRHGLTEVAP